jgi:hypothetical protein
MRRLFLTATVLCAAAPVAAQEVGRYELAPGANGFIRLDTRTGATSHCAPEDGVWRCAPLIEDAGVLAAGLEALAARVDTTTAALAELGARVDALAARVEASPSADVAPVEERGLVATAVARLFALVRLLKHGPAEA